MSAENSTSRKPSHRLMMIVGDSPDDVRAVEIGHAAPSADGRGHELRLEVTFSVIELPVVPMPIF
jgi:hypothetical protein